MSLIVVGTVKQCRSSHFIPGQSLTACFRRVPIDAITLPVRSNLLQNVDFGTKTSTTGIPIESICGQLFVHLNRRNTVSNLRRINPHCSVVGAIIGDILGTALLYTSQSL